jgi:hypothetical protein
VLERHPVGDESTAWSRGRKRVRVGAADPLLTGCSGMAAVSDWSRWPLITPPGMCDCSTSGMLGRPAPTAAWSGVPPRQRHGRAPPR